MAARIVFSPNDVSPSSETLLQDTMPLIPKHLGDRTISTAISRSPMDRSDDDYDDYDSGASGADLQDMRRMGKVQQLKRDFRPLAALSFSAVLQATWEFILISNNQGLQNGGLAGMFWSYLWTFIGFCFVIASLAEMASMAPTSGGQYHWVSEFASSGWQQFLSYITGWMAVLAWQAGAASGSFLTGTIIQGLISVHDPDYDPKRWQGTLFVFAMVVLIYLFNVYASSWMPRIQSLLLLLHIASWIVILVVLVVKAPHQSAIDVFTKFNNGGGWPTIGVSLMIGQISAIYGSLSSDATAHMSEEIKDAGRYVPIAILWGYIVNGILALVLLIAFLFSIPSVDDALNDITGFPFIYVLRNFMSTAGVNGLTAIILIPVIFSNILFNLSTARQTYAFARDKGLPFSDWISRVDPKRKIPTNAILLSCLISMLLSLINIGSTTAFNAIISLNVAALMFTYITAISCVIYTRLFEPDRLPARRWSLGRLGLPVNLIGLFYVMFAMFWSFWPPTPSFNVEDFNWSVVIFGGVLIVSLLLYAVHGRWHYSGPVKCMSRFRND